MSALLSRNGQILAMCCLIVGSVFPSVRSRYNFRQSDQIWDSFTIIVLNGQYVYIYSYDLELRRCHRLGTMCTTTAHLGESHSVFCCQKNASVVSDQHMKQVITVYGIISPNSQREPTIFF